MAVYLRGDVVEWDGSVFVAVADFRAGFLEPPLVIADRPDDFWKEA